MTRLRDGIVLLLIGMVGLTATAQQPPLSIDEQLAALRQDLAEARLQLERHKAQVNEVREFLAEKELDKKFEQWRELREELAEQRRKLKAERVQLEAVLDQMHRQTTVAAQQRAQDEQTRKQAESEARKPDWSAQYMMGLIDKERQTIYVDSTRGRVLLDQYPSIDRKNIKVRGTFLNKSSQPWRYTFEIRVGGENDLQGQPVLVGQWRYQTPLMSPGDLHAFEVTVPVSDVRHVEVIQIGNVKADRPAELPQPQPQPQPIDENRMR